MERYKCREVKFLAYEMLVFAIAIMFLTFLALVVKISRWGKNSLVGVKIHQVRTSETVNVLGPALDVSNSIFVYWHT